MKAKKLLFVILISLLYFVSIGTIKADTVHIQMPGGIQNYCQDIMAIDTFIFYKPLGFGSTLWRVDGVIVGSGDSFVFVPPTVSSFIITSSWNGNAESCGLNLFSAPPSHADFSVLSGGTVNATNDTIWMCGASIVIQASNIVGSDALSYTWYGPGVVNSTDNPIVLTNPNQGQYYFERPNPCGITRDTFELIVLPTTLPVWEDTTFCNVAVNLLLDPGPGWSYDWSTGATTQTLTVTTEGGYTVNLANNCTSGTVGIQVDQESYPLPDLSYLQGSPMCADSVLILDPNPNYTYETYLWSTDESTSTISISGLTTGGGLFEVTVTQGGCSAYTYGVFDFMSEPYTPHICVVSVDLSVNKNLIAWTTEMEPQPGDPFRAPIVYYNIYKAVSGWQLIGNVLATQEHVFVDASSSPPTVSALYKISAIDECGIETDMSYYHKTILLAVTQGANPGEIPLIWNAYVDESGTFEVDQYYIYRGDTQNTLSLLDSVSGYITSYIDTGIYSQKYYQIVVTKSGGCNTSPQGSKGGGKNIIMTIASNITNNQLSDITLLDELQLTIYPNPSNGIFHIKGAPISRVEITNQLGQVIAIFSNTSVIDLSGIANGMYYAHLRNDQGSTVKTLVIN